MKTQRMQEILDVLKTHNVTNIDYYLPFPKPYHGKGEIKAIVIGADPSTKDNLRFKTVFNLGGDDRRYFAKIERNLKAIDLSIDNVYVQNFCQNYFTKTTYDQRRNWFRASGIWYLFLKLELNKKFNRDIPLLVTSEIIFKRLIYYTNLKENKIYYENPDQVPVESCALASGRMVFPFFRHWRYNLERPEWEGYKDRLREYFEESIR